ncbi:MAG: bifunctional metallophosphatase/5'-nucleotidase [Ruminococcaceae bacterium]|nr:bifunctional metallophosphatase/5'-nucleotidase [Oscillospiraceae bacterium]
MKKKIVSFVLVLCFVMSFLSLATIAESNDEIVILYENDVHCAVDGYAKIAALKKEMAEKSAHVCAVSIGDFIQGSSLGAISQGDYIVELINLVGYDAVALGNHEFDYKLPRLKELVDTMSTKPVCSNFQKIGESETVFDPFSIVTYGDTDIAYIGVTTPDTLTSSSPAQFKDENGDYIYTFHGDDLYETVQKNINAAKTAGADYIIVLSHLGTEDVFEKWSAQTLVKNTEGIDVLLDGHSHSVLEKMTVEDKLGNDVIITSTGTNFENIGKLTISGGTVKTELISTETYTKTDTEVSDCIKRINDEYSVLGERKIGISKVDLIASDKDGNRLVRHTETNLGDFCADAFRIITDADIGLINGGGMRAGIPKGDVTFNDILNVYPFNNRVCVVEVTGQQILDLLELGLMFYPDENGSFQHVSGITFDLDKSVQTSVKLDSDMAFVSVDGEYRMSNVKVLNKNTDNYEPIGLSKKYTLASHNYLLLEQGGGATMLADANVLSDSGMLDVELLEVYITDHLNGVIGDEYKETQGRINVIDGKEKIPETSDANLSVLIILIGFAAVMVLATVLSNRMQKTF